MNYWGELFLTVNYQKIKISFRLTGLTNGRCTITVTTPIYLGHKEQNWRKGNGKIWNGKDKSGNLQRERGFLEKKGYAGECQNFNRSSPRKGKLSLAISSRQSEDWRLKAGFRDVLSPLIGFNGAGLPVGAIPVTSGRAEEPSPRTPAVEHRLRCARAR